MTTTPETLSTRLRAAADDIAFQGRPDPHDDKKLLREAARELETSATRRAHFGHLADRYASESAHLFRLLHAIAALDPDDTKMSKVEFRGKVRELAQQRMDPGVGAQPGDQWTELDSLRTMVAAQREHHHELGQYLVAAHVHGDVDDKAKAKLDGSDGEHTLAAALRLLKLAMSRGAYARGEHIQTEQGPMLLMQGEVIDAEFADFEEVEIAAKDICAGDRWIDAEGTRWHISDTWKTERGNWAANAREVKDDVFGPAARECIAEWKPEDLVTVEREPVREDTSPGSDPSAAGQARRALQRLGPTVAGVGGSIKLAAAIGIGPACGLSIDEFRPLLAAWNEAGTPRWTDEAIEVRLRDRYEQHKADFFADIPTTGPTSSEPEQDPAARLLPRPA